MSSTVPAGVSERLLALYAFLITRELPADRARIREAIQDYRQAPSEEAFERSFERDKAALRAVGLPLRTVHRADGPAYVLDQDGLWLPRLSLSARQRLFLGLASRLWEEPELVREGDQALRRLRVLTPEAASDREAEAELPGPAESGPVTDIPDEDPVTTARLDRLEVRLSSAPGLDQVLDALALGEDLRFTYRGALELTGRERRMRPWGLGQRFGHWYVHGWDPQRRAPRLFRLSRMAQLRRAPAQGWSVPTDLDLSAVLDGITEVSGPRAVLRAPAALAPLVRDWIEEGLALRADSETPITPEDGVPVRILDVLELARCLAEADGAVTVESPELGTRGLEAVRTRARHLVDAAQDRRELIRRARAEGRVRTRPVRRSPERESRYARFARLADLIVRLSEVPEAEVSQLAEEFGVDRRRIVKDLEILADAGDAVGDGADLRVEAHEDDVRLSLSTRLAGPVRLGPQQTLRLLLGTRLLAELLPDHDAELGELALMLARTLPRPDEAAAPVPALSVRLEEDLSRLAGRLREAARTGGRVRLEYRSRGDDRPRERLLQPLAVESRRGIWYLRARDLARDQERTYRLDAVHGVHDAGPGRPGEPDLPATEPEEARARVRTGAAAQASMLLWVHPDVEADAARELGAIREAEVLAPADLARAGLWRIPVRDPDQLRRVLRRHGGQMAAWEQIPDVTPAT